MTTPAAFDATLAAAFVAIPGVSLARLGSDYSDEWDRIQPGETRFQLRTTPVGFAGDSNQLWQVVVADFTFAHRLADPLNERAHTLGDYLTIRSTVSRLAWWRALAGVHAAATPRLEESVERVGHVIRWTGQVEVELNP